MHDFTRKATRSNVAALTAVVVLCAVAILPGGCDRGAPDVSLRGLDGALVTPLANLTRPVVFLFVRDDCPISNRYAPAFRRLHETYRDRVDFWLVYPDGDLGVAAIRTHIAAYEYACGVLRDPEHDLVALTGATITPEAAVYTAAGELVYRGRIDDLYEAFGKSRRAATRHELRDALESVIAGRPVAVPKAPAVGCYIVDITSTQRTPEQTE